jgi:hypothetical protein
VLAHLAPIQGGSNGEPIRCAPSLVKENMLAPLHLLTHLPRPGLVVMVVVNPTTRDCPGKSEPRATSSNEGRRA